MKHLVGMAGVLLGVAFAADAPDRTKLIGSWLSQSGDSRSNWTLSQNGDALHILCTEDGRKVSEIECNTAGRECSFKDAGKPVKVSMWFNGPKLVVMETRGQEVVKRRFHAADDGTLEIEVTPIVPPGKPELVHLTRAPESQ